MAPSDDDVMWQSDIEEREARRRKMFVFSGAAVAVLIGFAGLYAALSWVAGGLTTDSSNPPNASNNVGQGSTEPGEAPPPPISTDPAGSGELDWYAIESPLGQAERIFSTDTGAFYALSTIPGVAINWPPPKALYKSDDGESWEIIALDSAITPADVAVGGGALYLIGTAPGTGNLDEPQAILVSTSRDDGSSWTQSLLPTVATPPNGAPIEWSSIQTRVAANDTAIVAVANSRFFLDYRRMVPNEFVGNELGYNPTADGVEVMDYRVMEEMYITCEEEMAKAGDDAAVSEECQALFNGDESVARIGFVTWAEMGLGDGNEPAFAEMFVSSDGANFEGVTSPLKPGAELTGLYSTPNGFLAVGRDQVDFGGVSVFTSQDGREWQRIEDLPQLDWVTNVGSIGGSTVIVGQSRETATIVWENEAGGWETVDFDAVLGPSGEAGQRWLSAAGIGPMGVVAVFQSFDELAEREITEVALGAAPDNWSLVPINEITGINGGYSSWVAVGTNEILIRYEVTNQFRQLSLQVMGVRTN